MLTIPTRLALSLLTLTAACTIEFDDEDPTLRNCPTCGWNSPVINDFSFPELNLGGLPNSDGVSLVGLYDPKTKAMYKVEIDDREDLVALKGDTGVKGSELVGWELVLQKNGLKMSGLILDYDTTVPSLAAGQRPITSYAISFNIAGAFRNVCPTYLYSPLDAVLTIIRGATYDREHKRVVPDPNWVTLACADQAAYKAKRLGYDQTLMFAETDKPATIPQQDATLKMITADYCGKGTSYTEQDQKLYWQNTALTVTAPLEASKTLEAVWSENGALCLDTPRLVANHEVEQECMLPSCSTLDLDKVSHEWITWVP